MKRAKKKIAKRQTGHDQLLEKEKAMTEPERVVRLSTMGLSIKQISIELGRDEDFVRSNYGKQIQEGRIRCGAALHKVIWEKAKEGDRRCLSFLMYTLNHELVRPLPDIVKDLIAVERANSRGRGNRLQQNLIRPRDAKGRFKWEY